MDDLQKATIEALELYKQILTGGLVMAGGAASKLATESEREVCLMKAAVADRAIARARWVAELQAVCRKAHDTFADLAGEMGPSLSALKIDPTFRELVRVLFIDNPR